MSVPSLYELLPSLYREQDALNGYPLRALFEVVEQQRTELYAQIAQLYDDAFIDACREDAVSRIAEMLGLGAELPGADITRAAVARTLAARRRKGTAGALQRRILDFTGWFSQLRLVPITIPSRNESDAGCSTSQLLLVTIFPMTAYPLRKTTPFDLGNGRYLLHPLGVETPLFQVPCPVRSQDQPFTPEEVPVRLTLASVPSQQSSLVVEIATRVDGSFERLPILFRDLSNWEHLEVTPPGAGSALIDPGSGRMYLPAKPRVREASVSFAYGFPTEIGGGPYSRSVPRPGKGTWAAYVHRDAAPEHSENPAHAPVYRTLSSALQALADVCTDAVIYLLESTVQILSSDTDLPINVSSCETGFGQRRSIHILARSGDVAMVHGTLRVHGPATGVDLFLHGVWWGGSIELGGDVHLYIEHSTLRSLPSQTESLEKATKMPASISAMDNAPAAGLQVTLEASIIDTVRLPGSAHGIQAKNSIVESMESEPVPDHFSLPVRLINTTVMKLEGGAALYQENSLVNPAPHVLESHTYGAPIFGQVNPEAWNTQNSTSNGSEPGAFNQIGWRPKLHTLHVILNEYVPDGVEFEVEFPATRGY